MKMDDRSILLFPMTIDDYDQIHTLWMTIQGFGIRKIDDSKNEIKKFLDKNPTTSVVAKDGDRIVGTILCGSDGRQGTLYHVCVDKHYRRLGIGTRMVNYCMNRLKEIGINKATLIAFSNNDIGNAFWKQVSWHQAKVNYYEFTLNDNNETVFVNGNI